MTNPDYYEDDAPADPALTVLQIGSRILAGLALVTVATTALVVYASARAGQQARASISGAVKGLSREVRDTGRQVTQTAQAALQSAAGIEERRGEAPVG